MSLGGGIKLRTAVLSLLINNYLVLILNFSLHSIDFYPAKFINVLKSLGLLVLSSLVFTMFMQTVSSTATIDPNFINIFHYIAIALHKFNDASLQSTTDFEMI